MDRIRRLVVRLWDVLVCFVCVGACNGSDTGNDVLSFSLYVHCTNHTDPARLEQLFLAVDETGSNGHAVNGNGHNGHHREEEAPPPP